MQCEYNRTTAHLYTDPSCDSTPVYTHHWDRESGLQGYGVYHTLATASENSDSDYSDSANSDSEIRTPSPNPEGDCSRYLLSCEGEGNVRKLINNTWSSSVDCNVCTNVVQYSCLSVCHLMFPSLCIYVKCVRVVYAPWHQPCLTICS